MSEHSAIRAAPLANPETLRKRAQELHCEAQAMRRQAQEMQRAAIFNENMASRLVLEAEKGRAQ